jgi:hypothetical protein
MQGIFMSDLSLYNGNLEIRVTSLIGFFPIKNAVIKISYSNNPNEIIKTATTDESGLSSVFSLPSPKPLYSEEPSEEMPYSEYDIHVTAEGYEPVTVYGTEILPNVTAIQPISMTPLEMEPVDAPDVENIVIPDHTLYGDYPSKIPEAEIKPTDESGEIVLSRVVIPEYIVVHDGAPSDSTAKNYYVRYTDYIKNVVSSEIYATWSENTIYANTLAIMSFTLNRVYTEW